MRTMKAKAVIRDVDETWPAVGSQLHHKAGPAGVRDDQVAATAQDEHR